LTGEKNTVFAPMFPAKRLEIQAQKAKRTGKGPNFQLKSMKNEVKSVAGDVKSEKDGVSNVNDGV
jgi:hypothetical protein